MVSFNVGVELGQLAALAVMLIAVGFEPMKAAGARRVADGWELDGRKLLAALRGLRRGDFSVRLPDELAGIDGEIARIFNEVVSLNENITGEKFKKADVSNIHSRIEKNVLEYLFGK